MNPILNDFFAPLYPTATFVCADANIILLYTWLNYHYYLKLLFFACACACFARKMRSPYKTHQFFKASYWITHPSVPGFKCTNCFSIFVVRNFKCKGLYCKNVLGAGALTGRDSNINMLYDINNYQAWFFERIVCFELKIYIAFFLFLKLFLDFSCPVGI